MYAPQQKQQKQSMTTTYFITGTNRGIGLEFVTQLLQNPSNKVIGSVRDVAKSPDLVALASANKNLSIVTLEVGSGESIAKLSDQLEAVAPEGIDVFIQNAGYNNTYDTFLTASRDDMIDTFVVNTIGAAQVLQVVHPFLEKKETKKVVFISSLAGSNTIHVPSMGVYAASKAALNKVAGLIAAELGEKGYTVLILHPGVVETRGFTEMIASDTLSEEQEQMMKSLKISTKESAEMMLGVIGSAEKEKSGKFLNYDGTELPW